MAVYAYSAINDRGIELDGTITAADLAAAMEQLRQKGLLAQRIGEVGEPIVSANREIRLFSRVKSKSLQVFSRQLATMIQSGLNVVQSLSILEQQTSDRLLAEVVGQVREDVESGKLLSEALARHPRVFSRLYVAMVEAGEAGGILDIVLDRVALQMEKEQKIKSRVKGAMIYPIIVLCFSIVTLNGMLLFLIPVFQKIFAQLNGQLPTLTQMVVTASAVMRGWWFLIVPFWIGLVVGFFYWKRTETGRQAWDTIRLRFPLRIGDTVRKITLARFARTLATLVTAGVDIIKALEITGQAAGNWVVENALVDVRNKVREGASIAQPLLDHPAFPPMVAHMVRVGEETGELDTMLAKIADFYEEEVDTAIGALTSIIEPVLMICVGAMVGVIVLAMYLPMFKMLQLVH
ncbi:MAG: type II secretion system F family protein [Actinobacteria bacterium]|nr:type II secretion system F family protein [Actinomycetota bacterium]MBV8562378.1 type II secretion system F family protein [Actinomycetota bacterium]